MMLLLHRIEDPPPGYRGTNFDRPADVAAWLEANPDAPVSFDGPYFSVWEHREMFKGRDVTLFVVGDHVGRNNAWDEAEPMTMFCSWWQLLDMSMNNGFEIAWHTWGHQDLTDPGCDIKAEITPPFPMRSFAYPYGKYDQRAIEAVKRAGFERAYSTNRGDGTRYALKRFHLPIHLPKTP